MTARKTPAGAWKPGQSGNPKGRPKGSGKVAALRAAIAEQLPEVMRAVLAQALAGDTQAARLLLDRTIAPLKPTEQAQPLSLPDADLTTQGRAVLAAVAAGELAPGQGAALLASIGHLARVAELDDIERRLSALEKATP